jgi:hypothetical protein
MATGTVSVGARDNTINPDLLKERSGASFNPREVTDILDGGVSKTKRRKDLGS